MRRVGKVCKIKQNYNQNGRLHEMDETIKIIEMLQKRK